MIDFVLSFVQHLKLGFHKLDCWGLPQGILTYSAFTDTNKSKPNGFIGLLMITLFLVAEPEGSIKL